MKQRWIRKTFDQIEKKVTYDFENGEQITIQAAGVFNLCDIEVLTRQSKKTFCVSKDASLYAFNSAYSVSEYAEKLSAL